jgi:hypothetical protein
MSVLIKFYLTKQVRFTFEAAVDYGGPRRKLYHLLALEARETMFISERHTFFNCNVVAISVTITFLQIKPTVSIYRTGNIFSNIVLCHCYRVEVRFLFC